MDIDVLSTAKDYLRVTNTQKERERETDGETSDRDIGKLVLGC